MNIPEEYHKLFWDVPVEKLEWPQHKYFIMARFLNWGTMSALRWLQQEHHFMADVPDFMRSTHARKLDKRTLNFWKMYFGLEQLPWETETYRRLRKNSWID